MALPKLNDSPKYSINVPSTGKEVSFRPYLVKEEKTLMIALETQDPKATLNAVVNTIESCLYDKINLSDLTSFDIEYMFTQIRAKSAGETTSVGISCSECSAQNEITIKIDDIKVEVPEVSKAVELNGEVTMKLKWPSYASLASFETPDGDNIKTDDAFRMACKCIEAIEFNEERVLAEDCTENELLEFIESMNTNQFKTIMDWLNQMPKMEHTVNFDCVKCQHKNTQTLSGIQTFFS